MARFIYSNGYYCDIGAHIFATVKFRMVHDRLVRAGLVKQEEFITPRPATWEEIQRVHTREYVGDLIECRHTHRTISTELPISKRIVESFVLGAGGTVLAGRTAVQERTGAMNLAGGFHHAMPDWGEGFCYINDVALCVKVLKSDGLIDKAAIIDCDLHQGNGTAVIFQDDPSVFTFSIHQQNNYPYKRKGDLDVGLPDGVGDEEYLAQLEDHIPKILEVHGPEFVLYVAGADPFELDQLGGLRLSKQGLRRRDDLVIGECAVRGIPLAVTLAGGYAPDINDTVDIHFNTSSSLIDHSDAYNRQ